MITVDLNALSFSYVLEHLAQEGYIAAECIKKSDDFYDCIFMYPYHLYGQDNQIIDTVYFIEFCVEVEDDEYTDGRKTFEAKDTKWVRL